MKNWVVVDVEADGPCPGLFSMVSFGAVHIQSMASFYGQVCPISEEWVPEALAISGHSREEHLSFSMPREIMFDFDSWLSQFDGRPVFVSDNPAFDWQFINYYFHKFVGRNPFGFSARRIGDLYAGLKRDAFKHNEWKRLRQTKHTHNPVDDAMGNAEALLKIRALGLRM